MTSTTYPISGSGSAGLTSMAGIETRRFARHPVFLVGTVLAFAVLLLMYALTDEPAVADLLALPVIPAFFIGLTSLITAARLTRSTEVAVEAMGTAPGTEAQRTAAVAAACLVPFVAGVAWLALMFALVPTRPPVPQEWWFPTLPDWEVWSILVALGPVACLGGGLLGVLTGRWLRFPGAAAVVVVVLVAVDLVGQQWFADTADPGGSQSLARLWVPWAMFHSGSLADGTSVIFAGNPAWYLGYLLCLCAAAALVAIGHDRTARTRGLALGLAGVVVAGLACLALAVTTGAGEDRISDVVPFQVQE